MLEKIKKDLGINFNSDDTNVLEDILGNMTTIASNASNRKKEDPKLVPYIFTATKSAYIKRGDEGKKSSNEGSISASYEDIEEKLCNDIIKHGVRIIK